MPVFRKIHIYAYDASQMCVGVERLIAPLILLFAIKGNFQRKISVSKRIRHRKTPPKICTLVDVHIFVLICINDVVE